MNSTNIQDREQGVKQSRTFQNIRDIYGLSSKSVLDIGCGWGEYLRLFGEGSMGITTTPAEVDYGKKSGLSIELGNAERIDEIPFKQRFDAIWANNLFEHLLAPHAFLIRLKRLSHGDTIAVIGVPVVPKIVSLIRLKWFRGTLATNHISFFTHTTLRLSVERAGWKALATRPFFFKNAFLDALCRPFAPHMYVVAKNDEGFKYADKKLKEWVGEDLYAPLLAITKQK